MNALGIGLMVEFLTYQIADLLGVRDSLTRVRDGPIVRPVAGWMVSSGPLPT
jgi:hypothetical protein